MKISKVRSLIVVNGYLKVDVLSTDSRVWQEAEEVRLRSKTIVWAMTERVGEGFSLMTIEESSLSKTLVESRSSAEMSFALIAVINIAIEKIQMLGWKFIFTVK
jgi:hypothetical protein